MFDIGVVITSLGRCEGATCLAELLQTLLLRPGALADHQLILSRPRFLLETYLFGQHLLFHPLRVTFLARRCVPLFLDILHVLQNVLLYLFKAALRGSIVLDRGLLAMAFGFVDADVVAAEPQDACLESFLADVLLRDEFETAPVVENLVDECLLVVKEHDIAV